ncbi:hypothetical protein [Silvanigrella aquatica]|uniref:Uncharacterized protein n=1 Tax=Silvanigrella aquatica TaxID=1915309 RepID=A0A1L4CWY4_9BACT|nr:hypothetical protein [Silvanigrella aquatica]APJ02457.1 hypothetical protein AXG55_00315 [Silvanigrella aquatica]
MSVNKKQRKVNLLASQKIDLRSRKGTKKQKKPNFNKWYLLALFYLYVYIKKSISFVFLFFKSKPRLTYILSICILCLSFIKIGTYFVGTYSEKILPTHIQIETDNKQITHILNTEIQQELDKAIKANEKRSEFIHRINSILASKDIIDQYWIRLGLDGKLQINAIMQIPIMLIEAKNGERYIISNNMKIIAKNPLPQDYASLLKLEAPELKINWKSKNSNIKNKKNNKIDSNNSYIETNSSVNFPWLMSQTRFINSEMLKIGTGYSLAKIAWDSNSGFTLKINRNNQLLSQKNTENNNTKLLKNTETIKPQNDKIDSDFFLALLGENNINEKMERLKRILQELGNKNIYPNKIDLDFTDKASFKFQPPNPKSSQM